MVAVAMGDHHEIEPAEIHSQRPHIAGEDLPVVAGVEQDPLATILDQRRKAPVADESGTSSERIVENGDSMGLGGPRRCPQLGSEQQQARHQSKVFHRPASPSLEFR